VEVDGDVRWDEDLAYKVLYTMATWSSKSATRQCKAYNCRR